VVITTTGSSTITATRAPRTTLFAVLMDDPSLSLQTIVSPFHQVVLATSSAETGTATTESWRQYVPLAASAFVIVDVALGSPFAKNVMSIVRSMEQPKQENPTTSQEDSSSSSATTSPLQTMSDFLNAQNALTPLSYDTKTTSGKERVDTRAVAQQALNKAAASLELRQFLEDSKSDADRVREAQRKLDAQLRAYDEQKLNQPQKKITYNSNNDDDNPSPPIGNSTASFLIVPHQYAWSTAQGHPSTSTFISTSSSSTTSLSRLTATSPQKNGGVGDPLRAGTGIRPSLHPLTINALSSILQSRSNTKGPPSKFAVVRDNSKNDNLQVALAAGQVAAEVIQKRQDQSVGDNEMTLTAEECQTVAGRIVGVVVRLPELETLLQQKCEATPWIAKYNEWNTFGVVPPNESNQDNDEQQTRLDNQITNDPLFALHRAECLLALFLHTVEQPELTAKNVNVPDNSRIDFLDSDRRDVLLGE
jgi:hypothetical protein